MLNYVYLILVYFCILYFVRFGWHLVIKEAVCDKYRRWQKLNGLVSSTQKTNLMIAWISLQLIWNTMYISFLQYMNTTVRQIGKNVFEVKYVINGKIYKMIVSPTRGPAKVLQVSNENKEDITNLVVPYMGPKYDWHGQTFKPEFFGCKSLVFELYDGSEHVYTDTIEMKNE